MEAYLREMLVILPLLAVVAFEEIDTQAAPADRLHLKGKGAQATGREMLPQRALEPCRLGQQPLAKRRDG